MTQTILDPKNYDHQLYLLEWEDAAAAYNQVLQWKADNPPPPHGNGWSDWYQLLCAEQERLGIHTSNRPTADWRKGVIQQHRSTGTHGMRVWKPIRDVIDRIVLGPWVCSCPNCGRIYATDSTSDLFCSDECRAQHKLNTATAKAKRRQVRESERSEKLANRTGICLACGNEFTLKRITAKTCTEACKKRLQRKPELAAEYLVPHEIRSDLDQLIAEDRKLSNISLNLHMAAIGSELTEQQQKDLETVERLQNQRRPILRQQHLARALNSVAAHAPALGAWLNGQPTEVQEEACSWQGSKTMLGAGLWDRLRQDMGWH